MVKYSWVFMGGHFHSWCRGREKSSLKLKSLKLLRETFQIGESISRYAQEHEPESYFHRKRHREGDIFHSRPSYKVLVKAHRSVDRELRVLDFILTNLASK